MTVAFVYVAAVTPVAASLALPIAPFAIVTGLPTEPSPETGALVTTVAAAGVVGVHCAAPESYAST